MIIKTHNKLILNIYNSINLFEEKSQWTYGPFGLRGKEGKQSKIGPKLAYFQLTLLSFPPSSLNPNGLLVAEGLRANKLCDLNENLTKRNFGRNLQRENSKMSLES